MGRTSWRKGHWRKGKKVFVVPPAIVQIPGSVWNGLFTTSASVVTGRL
jgi:hypothetical protein